MDKLKRFSSFQRGACMGVEIKTLPLVKISKNLPCIKPEADKNPVTGDHPAIEVMTDFEIINPVKIEPFNSIDTALDRMKIMGVRLLLVTDEADYISGVITSYDLQSEKSVRYTEDTGIKHKDITVEMIMTPIHDTPAVDLDYVRQSLVKHVINTLKDLDRPHILVIENTKSNKQKIRGLFSSSQISKVLGRKIYEPLHASRSLAELKQKIN
jgi:signal-transduction protein with cAMP-binding, CBS, and nucleotidyltransferase domain